MQVIIVVAVVGQCVVENLLGRNLDLLLTRKWVSSARVENEANTVIR